MSNTTQILFNSPALHALKRDQLVKLCKIHSIKASGKNTELIEKLKQHALTLQNAEREVESNGVCGNANDDMEGIETEGNAHTESLQEGNESNDAFTSNWRQMPRPSEQWEVVMDSIEEVDEGPGSSQNTVSSKGTLRTLGSSSSIGNMTATGEFGTGSSKSSSVTSSIKALATSLGLNRVKSSSSKSIANVSTSTYNSSFASVPSSVPSLPNTIKKSDPHHELMTSSVPYSSLPEANNSLQTDHLTFVPPSPMPGAFGEDSDPMIEDSAPLPGHPLRPGRPAPAAPDARLSLGLNTPAKGAGPSTTIRLVSSGSLANVASLFEDSDKDDRTTGGWDDTTWVGGNTPKLKPFETTFDLVLGSPGPIYPPLPLDDLIMAQASKKPGSSSNSQAPGISVSTPSKTSSASTSKVAGRQPSGALSPPRPEPFVFGSPLPQHRLSNAQFQDAAKNVLEEMNKRLAGEGVEGVSTDVLKQLDPSQCVDLSSTLGKSTPDTSPSKRREVERAKVREKFDRAHEEAFGKMAGINEPVGAGRKRKSDVLDEYKGGRASAANMPRKRSSVGVGVRQGRIGVNRASGARVISGGRRKAQRALPGGFGDDDDEDSVNDGEGDGQDGAEDAGAERAGKKVRVEDEETARKAVEEEAARKEKERERVKRHLEKNKAARRSSMGVARQSMGRGRVSVGRNAVQPKPKPGRFGFLSSAKNLVTGMWKGKSAAKPATAAQITTGIPVPSKSAPTPAQSSTLGATATAGNPKRDKGAISVGSGVPPGAVGNGRRVPSGSSSSRDSALLKPGNVDKTSTMKSNTSARSRSPIPSFGAASGSRASALGTRTSTSGSVSSSATKSSGTLLSTRQSSVSSQTNTIGSTVNSTRTGGGSRVSSLGTRNSRVSTMSETVDASSKNSKSSLPRPTPRPSSSSRLMAPTASSLAKMHTRGSTTGLDTVKEKENHHRPTPGIALASSPKPGIFSKHLLSSPSSIPTPIKPASVLPSFGNAGAALASTDYEVPTKEGADFAPKPIAPKPRSLNGRKPRISRSKVIAKLASKRAASGSSGKVTRPSLDAGRSGASGRTRSSLGAQAQRQSLGGGLKSGKAEAILMAKKRARASEYARRKSVKAAEMNVDD